MITFVPAAFIIFEKGIESAYPLLMSKIIRPVSSKQ